MIELLTHTITTASTVDEAQPQPSEPWQQAGRPPVRVEVTAGSIHPYELHVGEHAALRVPMTAAAVVALRDALSAVLAQTTPTPIQDFVTEWAQTHGAVVKPGASTTDDVLPTVAVCPSDSYVMAA